MNKEPKSLKKAILQSLSSHWFSKMGNCFEKCCPQRQYEPIPDKSSHSINSPVRLPPFASPKENHGIQNRINDKKEKNANLSNFLKTDGNGPLSVEQQKDQFDKSKQKKLAKRGKQKQSKLQDFINIEEPLTLTQKAQIMRNNKKEAIVKQHRMNVLTLMSYKAAFVPLVTEWLCEFDLVHFDTALLNEQCRLKFVSLMNEYFFLFFKSKPELKLYSLYYWSRKYSFFLKQCPTLLITNYDLLKINPIECESYNNSFRSAVNVSVNVKCDNEDIVTVLSQLDRIETLSLGKSNLLVVNSFFNNCTALTSLCITITSDETVVAVAELLRHCPSLRRLNTSDSQMSSIFTFSGPYSRSAYIVAAAIHCKHLTHIKSCSKSITLVVFIFSMHCRGRLIEYDIEAELQFDSLLNGALLIANHGDTLSKLNIKNELILSHFFQNRFILNKFKKIPSVGVSFVWSTEEECNRLITTQRCHLKQVNSLLFESISPLDVLNVCSLLPSLHKLSLHRISLDDKVLLRLLKMVPSVTSLTIDDCRELSKVCFVQVLNQCGQQLTHLVYHNYMMDITCDHLYILDPLWFVLTEVSIVTATTNLDFFNYLFIIPTLTKLNFEAQVFMSGGIYTSENNLTDLTLDGKMMDSSLFSLIIASPKLRHFTLYPCDRLTPSGIVAIIPWLKNLTVLCLHVDCPDNVVEAVCTHLKRLQSVLLHKISPSALQKLKNSCVSLVDYN